MALPLRHTKPPLPGAAAGSSARGPGSGHRPPQGGGRRRLDPWRVVEGAASFLLAGVLLVWALPRVAGADWSAIREVLGVLHPLQVAALTVVWLVEDFEVVETERRTTAAVALCVDMSWSMVQEGRWGPMKQTALALSHLVQTRYRHDALQIIGFNLAARRLSPVQLAEAEPEWVQGTNLQHALMLAGRHLRRHPDAEPVVLVVTDGEPTAHLGPDGIPEFMWPTTSATLRATVAQVDELRRSGAALNVFMLGEDPGLARFVDAVARRAGGRVFTPSIDRLGEYVVADYLRARRGRR